MKKTVLLTFMLAAVIALICITGITASAETYTGTCGDDLTWTLDTETGVLNIDGTGDMYNYDYSYGTIAPWREYDNYLKSVVIGDSVTSIGSYAFSSCDSITTVSIPVSVINIRTDAFNYCLSLVNITVDTDNQYYTSVDGVLYNKDMTLLIQYTIGHSRESFTIPDTVTSINSCTFYRCKNLTEVTFGNSVKSIGSFAFGGCYNLKNIYLSDSVVSIDSYAFDSCSSVTNIYIPASVTSIGGDAFRDCYSLTDISVDTSNPNYTSIDGVLYNKDMTTLIQYPIGIKAESFDIPDTVTKIGSDAFWSCEYLTSVIIPDSVINIGNTAFCSCVNLESVTIPDSVTTIGFMAFYACSSLTEVTVPKSVTVINNHTFSNCRSLTSVTITASVTKIYETAFEDTPDVVIRCFENTYAHSFAVDMGISYEIMTCEHSFTNYVYDNNATCTEDGTKTAYCDNDCGASDTVTEEGSGGHRYTREEILREPTCTRNGYKLLFCECGASKNETLSPIPHIFSLYDYNNDETCTSDGTESAYCGYGCGTVDTRTVEGTALAHLFNDYLYNNDATCTSDGTETAYCNNGCGISDTRTVEGSMLTHLFADYLYNNDATCTSDGTESAYCGHGCGATDTRTVTGTKTSHDFFYDILGDSTCTVEGVAWYSCRGCDYGYHILLPTVPHNYVPVVTTEPTCNKEGVMTYTCTGCSRSYTESIPMTDHSYSEDILEESTCTTQGLALYLCVCGDFYTVDLPLKDHSFGDWSTVKKPTATEAGEERRSCTVCGETEKRAIIALPKPEVTTDNYTVIITNAEYIRDIRYVLGTYTTTDEIRNAEGNVALSNAIVVKNTVNGNFVYDLPDGGIYSIWIRMQDGTNYIMPLDMTFFSPEISTYGVKITVDGLYGVKDYFIAEGEHYSYNAIKDNGYIVRVTASKIAGKHSYTYTVTDPGFYTVLVRYNNGREFFFHVGLSVDKPVFTTNGLQVTVSNIPDVKVIRTAYGEYYTPGDTKRAPGARNFSNKSVINNAESYMLQYRENGIVTIVVEYNNGYVEIFHYNVQKKTPTVEQTGNSITFGDLDGLMMIRYAEGKYSSSSEIKRAPGSKVLKADAIVDGKITVEMTKNVLYTFCVQYDDDSYYYISVVPGITITTQPGDHRITAPDESVVFNVAIEGGSGSYTYDWYILNGNEATLASEKSTTEKCDSFEYSFNDRVFGNSKMLFVYCVIKDSDGNTVSSQWGNVIKSY